MKTFTMWIRLAFLAALAATISRAAEPFAVPTEISPPFRRDALPLDADTMAGLSRDITLLAQAGEMDSPPARRAVAQALAIAIALDPKSAATTVLGEIAGGQSTARPNEEKLNHAKGGIWRAFTWLASPGAGRDGNLLADLIGDAASALDPGNPAADSLRGTLEKGKWDGWVEPVTAFEKRKPVIPEVIAKVDPKPPEKTPDPKLPDDLKSSTASLKTVLYEYRENTDSYVLGSVAVSMEASPHREDGEGEDDGRRLRVRISCHEDIRWEVFEKVSSPIIKALEKLHGDRLPKGDVRISTGTNGTYSYKRNGDDMTGPGFILANSALTGIAPEAIFIGTLDGSNKLKLPDFFWKKMATLVGGSGGRLVVPTAAEPYFTALLAAEKPDFFMKYDVLLASSPQEAIRLCAKTPDAELAATLAKFKEIKDKAGTTALGSYLANSFIRKRLVEISQSSPYHLSAKLLAIQGAGARPRAFEKKILAAEIFEAIDPIHVFTGMDIWSINGETVAAMDAAYETSSAHLDRLERYAEMRDRELIESAGGLFSKLRSLSRIIRDRREMWEKSDDVERAQRELRHESRDLRRKLAELTGDPLPKEEDD